MLIYGLGIPTKDDPERSNQADRFFIKSGKDVSEANKNNAESAKNLFLR